ncbi:MAG TPA: hypothetical protein PKO15_15060 [Fibrobacteria bacterium]|nr:hypothetical protein [Fibrobacteria bacterium]HOX50466.1 hypothetical protein [Fibrobacteria bacterium]
MKSSLLLCACTAFSLLASCDSGSSPTQVETVTVRDTLLLNDRFARNAKVVHGRWTIKTSTDSADTWIYQDTNKVTALVQWAKSTSWTLEGTETATGWTLKSKDQEKVMYLKVLEEKDLKVNKLKLTIIANSELVAGEPTAERRQ